MAQTRVIPVILSGGAGSRLWPLSTLERPKQYHRLTGADTMLAETLGRVSGIAGIVLDPAWIICGDDHAALSRETLDRLGHGDGRVICEPEGRNTAPAAALACLMACETDPDACLLILPSDHHIGNVAAFRDAVSRAAGHAQTGRLVAFGIRPSHPETGYGYIERGEPVGDGFEIARFVEKPPRELAESMLANGGFDWNAGIFLFHAGTFIAELGRLDPAMLEGVRASLAGAARASNGDLAPDADAWAATRSDSIDYAVMQGTDRGRVVAVDMDWSDLGSFQSLWERSGGDERGNVMVGDVLNVDSAGCYVRAEGGRPVALVGCEDMVVIDTGKAILVMPRARAQSVKEVVNALKAAGRTEDL